MTRTQELSNQLIYSLVLAILLLDCLTNDLGSIAVSCQLSTQLDHTNLGQEFGGIMCHRLQYFAVLTYITELVSCNH